MSEKIRAHHLSRKAMLYVRQSSQTQVLRNAESRRLQYGMRKRLLDFGWREVEVVDEDLGRSAAESGARSGFERVVAEVCLGRVGVVAAREASRLARNSRDWQQLIEVCRVVDTLLVDHETVYDPRRGNDRLLLGLKGSLNEYELDILRLRSVEARYEKARRGELIVTAPVGYVKTTDGRLEKMPDRRVQEVIRLAFSKTLECGAARQALLWLIEHEIELPSQRHGPHGWETVWRQPTYGSLVRMLQNPAYAGMYAYGRTERVVELHGGIAKKKMKWKPRERWLALLPDHHEGYVTRDEFERIQTLMSQNSQAFRCVTAGAPKKGKALLAGLMRCRRCGRKLNVRYGGGGDYRIPRYGCTRGSTNYAEPRCISVSAIDVDDVVANDILRVVEPAATEASMLAAREAATHRNETLRALELDLESAQYAAERTRRQFDAADPENRLVAGELERRWNEALERVRGIERRVDSERAMRNAIQVPDANAVLRLAKDLPHVWNHPATDVRLKKRIVRTLIEEIVVDVDVSANEVVLVIHWKGGMHTDRRLRKRRPGESRQVASRETIDVIRELVLLCDDTQIAGYLNRNGLRTGKGNRWTRERVTSLRNARSIPCHSPEKRQTEGWMTLTQAALHVGVGQRALRQAAERGLIIALHPLQNGPWIFRSSDLDRASAYAAIELARERKKGGTVHPPGQTSLF